ncbi:MAG: hypothetical protein JOZ60_02430 [Verrucomicrobia bacterium]|nr:hypothetical protein [Verrucomicrobiota bacterium]
MDTTIPTVVEFRVAGTSMHDEPRNPLSRGPAPAHVNVTATTAMSVPKEFPLTSKTDWATLLSESVHRLAALKAGWDGVGSIPVRRALLDEATRIVRQALVGLRNAAPPYLVPGGDGSVQIEWHQKNQELELDLAADGSRWIWIRDHLSGQEIEGEDDRAVALLSRWAPRIAAIPDDESDVPPTSNTAIFGITARPAFYQDHTIT